MPIDFFFASQYLFLFVLLAIDVVITATEKSSAIFQGCFAILHFLSQDGSQMCWQKFCRPKRNFVIKELGAARGFSKGGGRAVSESGDLWALVGTIVVSIGAVVPSSLHMYLFSICPCEMFGVQVWWDGHGWQPNSHQWLTRFPP